MIKVGVFGHQGRMGQEIIQEIKKHDQLVAIIPEVEGQEILPVADIWIDFSSPAGLESLLVKTEALRTPIVSGTTGLEARHETLISKHAAHRPLLWAPNMSLGVAWLNSVLPKLAQLKKFDIQILDFHHSKKLDSPSGTARALQATLDESNVKTVGGPLSLRLGGIHGVHQIFAVSDSEWITLEHRAMNRSVFAEGAVFAANWLMNQPAGRYSMSDVLPSVQAT